MSENSEGDSTFLVYDITTNAKEIKGAPNSIRHCCSKEQCIHSQCQSCAQSDLYSDPLDFKAVRSVYKVSNHSKTYIRKGVSLGTSVMREVSQGTIIETIGVASDVVL